MALWVKTHRQARRASVRWWQEEKFPIRDVGFGQPQRKAPNRPKVGASAQYSRASMTVRTRQVTVPSAGSSEPASSVGSK